MDQKTWLWRKKSTEKTIITADNVNLPSKGNEEEIQTLLSDKAELQKDLKDTSEKLSSALAECNAKEDLIIKHAKLAQEAIAGLKKTEAEAESLKQELDRALQQKVAFEEKVIQLDAALKECMQQLRFVREDQERRIEDTVIKISREFEESQEILREKLADTSERLAKMIVENTHLNNALLTKEKFVDDLTKRNIQWEADFSALTSKVESMEKENGSLRYDVRVLEKEVEIRNEEREFNHRASDAAHKQHLDNVRKIAKLESECQRLRLLVRKRLPGPAALAKMRNEVEMLENGSIEIRRRKSNSNPNISGDNSPNASNKRIRFLTQQLLAIEEENKSLKESLNKKTNELQLSRIMYAQTASKFSQVELHLDESSRSRPVMEPRRSDQMSYGVSLASASDIGSDDKASCAESWASVLISELEHFKNGEQKGSSSTKSAGASEINLMDDFLEMEKLALVSVDKTSGVGHFPSDGTNAIVEPLETEATGNSPKSKGGEIAPVSGDLLGSETAATEKSVGELPLWVQDILRAGMEHYRITQRHPRDIVKDVREALGNIDASDARNMKDESKSPNHHEASNSAHITGLMSWKPADGASEKNLSNKITDVDVSLADKADLSKAVNKVIELIEGINSPSSDFKNSQTPSGYTVRVFQGKTSELSAILEQFVCTCYDLLNGKADLKKFAQEVRCALDWIMNHCFSLQDVSCMKDAFKKHFNWDESQSESELEVGSGHHLEADNTSIPLPLSIMREENRRLNDDILTAESVKKDLEARLQSAINESESLKNRLQESEDLIARLQTELQSLHNSRETSQNQIDSHNFMNEELATQLATVKVELKEARQNFSSLQVELENRTNYCEELESKCLELKLQLESVTQQVTTNDDLKQEEKQFRSEWEITAASEKLAECQETILNLGKQLKALAPPGEAVLFDKLISAPTDTTITHILPMKSIRQRSSLLDQMLAEDDAESTEKEPQGKIVNSNGIEDRNGTSGSHSLAIVPVKKKGGVSLWKKLLWRKKNNSKKVPVPFSK